MRKGLITLLLFFFVFQLAAQKQRTVNVYLQAQQNLTMYDVTQGNNPHGMGIGIQAFLNTKSRFKATMELTGDVYLLDDKVLRTRQTISGISGDEAILESVPAMVNLFAGASWHPAKNFCMSVTVGPSLINGKYYLGFKPALCVLTDNQRWIGKAYFINIFDRDFPTQSDFGSIGLSIGFRLH